MGKLGDMANKAKEMAKAHPDQADKGVDSAERMVDERTGDKYDAQTDKPPTRCAVLMAAARK